LTYVIIPALDEIKKFTTRMTMMRCRAVPHISLLFELVHTHRSSYPEKEDLGVEDDGFLYELFSILVDGLSDGMEAAYHQSLGEPARNGTAVIAYS
jgi:hypothetical protein